MLTSHAVPSSSSYAPQAIPGGRLALAFPGQGAQDPQMLAGVRRSPGFRRRYQLICDHTHTDIIAELDAGNRALLDRNVHSSMMTILVSSLCLDTFEDQEPMPASFFAGYSVGQWAAMYAAKMMTFERLVRVLVQRAAFMDECAETLPAAMSAVIGLPRDRVEQLLQELRDDGHQVYVANYNCLGQYSIAGTHAAVALAEEKLRLLSPRKLARLPVSGAWHCPLLGDAERRFAEYLQQVRFDAPSVPVVDNVTAEWLPADNVLLRQTLAKHISHPVQWERSMKKLIAEGCSRCIEIGYGKTLTKFGFFIDRNTQFSAFHEC